MATFLIMGAVALTFTLGFGILGPLVCGYRPFSNPRNPVPLRKRDR